MVLNQLLATKELGDLGDQDGEAGAAGHGRQDKEKEGPRPDKETFSVRKGSAEEHTRHAAQRALVEAGQKNPDGRYRWHGRMQVMCKRVGEGKLVELAVFQDQRAILDAQNHKIACDTESHFSEHRMDIGMPEDKPAPKGLSDVDSEYGLS
jgi:hypothetical protein